MDTCKAFSSQGSEWCVTISASLLLDVRRTARYKGEGTARSASLGRGTQITWQRALVWTQGGVKNPGPLRCQSPAPADRTAVNKADSALCPWGAHSVDSGDGDEEETTVIGLSGGPWLLSAPRGRVERSLALI